MRTIFPLLAILTACGGPETTGSPTACELDADDCGDNGDNGQTYSSIEGTWALDWLGEFVVEWDGDDAFYAEADGYEGTFYSYGDTWSLGTQGIGAWCAPDDDDVCSVIVELTVISNGEIEEVHGTFDENTEQFVSDGDAYEWTRN